MLAFHARTERWAIIVAHRRYGKTVAAINDMLKRALMVDTRRSIYSQQGPRYAYIAPTREQAKDIGWQILKSAAGVLPNVVFRESDLTAELPNGAKIRLYGAENYDRMRGLPFDGVAFDEDAMSPSSAWVDVVRACLADRMGWAVFISTFAGRNHFWRKYQAAQTNPEWYTALLPASKTGVIDPRELASLRAGMSEDLYNQEFECSPASAVIGAYYRREFERIDAEGRIGKVAHQPQAEVHTAWDLGRSAGNAMAVWFFQQIGQEVHIIDYYEREMSDLPHFVQIVKSKPYIYGRHYFPHDVEVTELGTGLSRVETLRTLGLKPDVCRRTTIDEGVDAVRALMPRCWFDQERCARGIDALREYRADYSEKRDVFSTAPYHNWASNGADAFRYLAVGMGSGVMRGEWSKPLPGNIRRVI